MLLVYSNVLLFTLLTIHLSPATVGVGAAAVVAGGTCLECPLEEDRGSRGKLSFNPIIAATDEGESYLKAIALANSPGTLVGGGGGGVSLHEQHEHEQQKSRFYHAAQQLQHQQKILAQQQQRVPSSSAPSPSNLLHFYTLLNKGSAQEPRVIFDGYYLQDSGVPIPTSRIAKKAERGMRKTKTRIYYLFSFDSFDSKYK